MFDNVRIDLGHARVINGLAPGSFNLWVKTPLHPGVIAVMSSLPTRSAGCGSVEHRGLPMHRRLIVVAREEPDLFDFMRRDQFGDDSVVVIADRRCGDRRRCQETVPADRRRDDRRRVDLEPLLRTQGWGEVALSE